ncbi:MAG: hypothetical protein AVDCRST_MAG88-929, partial [uncultured Thermomicrobiales bacterium]
ERMGRTSPASMSTRRASSTSSSGRSDC